MKYFLIPFLLLACESYSQPTTPIEEKPWDISVGLGVLNAINLELGYTFYKHFALEAYLGSSLFIGTASLYLDYEIPIGERKIVKMGIGKSYASACGHECGTADGFDFRVKYAYLPFHNGGFGFYGGAGYFIGSGNLFGSDPTHLPHLSSGLNWRI